MTKTIVVLFTLLLGISAHAFEIHSVKKSGTGLNVVTLESFNKVWNSSTLACIKDGGSVVGGNKAYITKIGKSGKPCAASEGTQRMNKIKYGAEVVVFKANEVPEQVLRVLARK